MMKWGIVVLLFLFMSGCVSAPIEAPLTKQRAYLSAKSAGGVASAQRPIRVTPVIGQSMMEIPSNCYVILVNDWDNTKVGQIIEFWTVKQSGQVVNVIHKIVGGSRDSGWITKGTRNSHPDRGLATKSDYIGTYIGHILHEG
jgi:hypothetical protein